MLMNNLHWQMTNQLLFFILIIVWILKTVNRLRDNIVHSIYVSLKCLLEDERHDASLEETVVRLIWGWLTSYFLPITSSPSHQPCDGQTNILIKTGKQKYVFILFFHSIFITFILQLLKIIDCPKIVLMTPLLNSLHGVGVVQMIRSYLLSIP